MYYQDRKLRKIIFLLHKMIIGLTVLVLFIIQMKQVQNNPVFGLFEEHTASPKGTFLRAYSISKQKDRADKRHSSLEELT